MQKKLLRKVLVDLHLEASGESEQIKEREHSCPGRGLRQVTDGGGGVGLWEEDGGDKQMS